jgi:hypothetical protein
LSSIKSKIKEKINSRRRNQERQRRARNLIYNFEEDGLSDISDPQLTPIPSPRRPPPLRPQEQIELYYGGETETERRSRANSLHGDDRGYSKTEPLLQDRVQRL